MSQSLNFRSFLNFIVKFTLCYMSYVNFFFTLINKQNPVSLAENAYPADCMQNFLSDDLKDASLYRAVPL